MSIAQSISEIADRHTSAVVYTRATLKLAIALLQMIEAFPDRPPTPVKFTIEEYLALPDRFELLEGELYPKHWSLYERGDTR